MIAPAFRRPVEAWRALVGLVAAVTQPRADVALCDARVEALAADSRIGRVLAASADACRRAAANSSSVAACRRMITSLVPGPTVERIRAVGCVATVAAATNLVLRIAGTGTEPLTWIVPAAVGTIGLLLIAAAQPLARAIANYHS